MGGQVSTGKKVAGSAAGEMKYVTMELGGKSPVIVLDDCKVENAVDGAMMANFFSTGQVCTNGTRVFVPRSMKASFEKTLLKKMEYIRVGDLAGENTNFGPLVSKAHYEKATLIKGGVGKPANLPSQYANGYWLEPTVFT